MKKKLVYEILAPIVGSEPWMLKIAFTNDKFITYKTPAGNKIVIRNDRWAETELFENLNNNRIFRGYVNEYKKVQDLLLVHFSGVVDFTEIINGQRIDSEAESDSIGLEDRVQGWVKEKLVELKIETAAENRNFFLAVSGVAVTIVAIVVTVIIWGLNGLVDSKINSHIIDFHYGKNSLSLTELEKKVNKIESNQSNLDGFVQTLLKTYKKPMKELKLQNKDNETDSKN